MLPPKRRKYEKVTIRFIDDEEVVFRKPLSCSTVGNWVRIREGDRIHSFPGDIVQEVVEYLQ